MPRVPPASRSELGLVNAVIAGVAGKAIGAKHPLNLFATLGRHRWLFRRWLVFAGGLMPGGKLPRADSELVILRVAHLCSSPYEADHHRRLGRKAGLTDAQMEFRDLSDRQRLLVAAADELHADKRISDATFASLREHLSDRDLIELCMLAGHYEMLAGTINSLGIELDRR